MSHKLNNVLRRSIWPFAALVLLVGVVVRLPTIMLPRVIKQLSDPTGKYVAEVVISDASANPIRAFLTIFQGKDVCVQVRIKSVLERKIENQAIVASFVESEESAKEIEIKWSYSGTVEFSSPNGVSRILHVVPFVQ